MIELTDPHEIAALRLRWEMEQQQRCTNPPEYTESREAELKRIEEDFRASEEKRLAKRARRHSVRTAGKKAEAAENERWERIFKEKFEDKSYYAR